MRIISLLPSATELLFAIGAGDEVVGVTHECDFPPEARSRPALTSSLLDHGGRPSSVIDRHIKAALHQGSSLYGLDERRLAELRPDLIVTQELCRVCAVAYTEVDRAVRRLHGSVPVVSLEPSSVEDVCGTALTLGRLTGHLAEAEALVADMRRRMTAVERLPRPRSRPAVACIEWTDPIMAGGHWVPEMVARAGGRDVLGVDGQPSVEVAWQRLRDAAPEVMVLMPCGFDLDRTLEAAPEVTMRPGYADLPCARSGRVVAVDGSSYFNRPGPRIVAGLEILAAALRRQPSEPLPPGAAWVPAA